MRTVRTNKDWRLWRVLVAMIAIGAVVLSACGGDDDAAPDGASNSGGDESGELETTTLRVGLASANVDQAVVAIADEMGFFADEGLEVEILFFNDGPSSTRALLSGDADVVMGSLQAPLLAQAAGQDMVAFYGSTQPQFSWWAKPEFESLNDLDGGSIATNPPGSLPHLLTEYMLDELADFGADGATLVPVSGPGARVTALDVGQTDAAILAAAESHWAETNGYVQVATMGDFEGTVPNTFNASQAFLDGNPNTISAFVAAIEAAVEVRDSDPDAVLDVVLDFTELQDDAATYALQGIVEYQPEDGAIAEVDSDLLVELMLQSGDIDREYERDEYIDSQFMGS